MDMNSTAATTPIRNKSQNEIICKLFYFHEVNENNQYSYLKLMCYNIISAVAKDNNIMYSQTLKWYGIIAQYIPYVKTNHASFCQ